MTPGPRDDQPPQLVRAIGRWSMVALAVNCILGSGIFGIACYAEAASQFTGTGGHYLYVRQAFGRFAGVQVGWMTLLSRLTACAAAVNLLVISLAQFWPGASAPLPRAAIVSLMEGSWARYFARLSGGSAMTLFGRNFICAAIADTASTC